MNRRDFLKLPLLAAAVAAIPRIAKAKAGGFYFVKPGGTATGGTHDSMQAALRDIEASGEMPEVIYVAANHTETFEPAVWVND